MAAMPTAYGSIASPGFDLLTAPVGISQGSVVSSRDEQHFQRRGVQDVDLSGGILNGYAMAADLAAVIEEHVKGERERERLKEEVRRLSAECDTARQRVLQMTEELEQERQAVQKAEAALAQQAAAQACAAILSALTSSEDGWRTRLPTAFVHLHVNTLEALHASTVSGRMRRMRECMHCLMLMCLRAHTCRDTHKRTQTHTPAHSVENSRTQQRGCVRPRKSTCARTRVCKRAWKDWQRSWATLCTLLGWRLPAWTLSRADGCASDMPRTRESGSGSGSGSGSKRGAERGRDSG